MYLSGVSNGQWRSFPEPKEYVEPNEEEIARLQRAAKVLDPEVMKHVPPEFNSSFKNPCWTAVNGEFRCLPYFYITGMFHAGALSLQDKLAKHPDVLTRTDASKTTSLLAARFDCASLSR
ncbi:hypothetical protein TSOC_001819 [Tetrabaena socialis]|uniref:Uncharacterized protein n=1 Tax=Tetrabaena socialis TaxID=47790 RepID=A0A2J8AFW2_9CHLO|nr:hypothetical protein TSOC_001819 [Tetrabaena socialis]|eukprot:PNH11414.1 hypothetical protein TSOC_001819 [Tetrabaena socialis]